MSWKITRRIKEKLNDPVLIVSLPGIGNVGKIAVDFLIEELKAKKMYDFFSDSFPNSVFVNEKNMIELPTITMYYKKRPNNNDLMILTGDIQPTTEKSCFEFCSLINKIASDYGVNKIITLAGIGLKEDPAHPDLHVTGNQKKLINEFKKRHQLKNNIYGIVGPILGVSGVLPGLSTIPSLILLAETFNHPYYAGINGSKRILEALKKEFNIRIDLNKLSKEVKEIEEIALEKSKKIDEVTKRQAPKTTSYIG